jgi:hypothetical protein
MLISIIFAGTSIEAEAQDVPVPRFEIGPFLTWQQTFVRDFGDPEGLSRGFGARAVANFSPRAGAEFQISRHDRGSRNTFLTVSGNLKIGLRYKSVNPFLIAGVGTAEVFRFRGAASISGSARVTASNINVGGGVELVLVPRFALRLDIVDAILFLPDRSGSGIVVPALTRHTPRILISPMFRF